MSAPPLIAQILDAVPAPTFLVDGDVVVQYANRAGRALASVPEGEGAPESRGGELLGCSHAEDDPDGCGRAAACSLCVIRNSVAEAFLGGPVTRQPTTVHLREEGGRGVTSRTVLVSASAVQVEGDRLAVLTIEDVSELALPGGDPAT